MTIKDLKIEVDKLRSRSRYWLLGAIVALTIFIVLVIVIFRHKPVNEAYESQIRTLDSLIKYQKSKIETLERYNVLIDSNIQRLDEQYKNNRPIETRIITKYEKVPVDVNSLDREQLRREITNY